MLLVGLFRDKWKLLGVFLLTLSAAAALSFMLTPKFVAGTMLFVKYGREYTYRAETGTSEIVPNAFDREQIIRSEIQILGAGDVVDQAIAATGIERLYPDLAVDPSPAGAKEQARQRFLDSLEAQGGDESNVISVTFRHPDREVAIEALDALINAYMVKRRPLFAEVRSQALDLETQGAQLRLERASAALSAFQRNNDIIAFDAQRRLLLEQKNGLERDLQGAESGLAAGRERGERLRSDLETLEPTIVLQSETQRNRALGDAQRALIDLQLREEELLDQWAPNSQPVVQVRRGLDRLGQTIAELEREPERLVRRGPNPIHDTLATQYATVAAQVSADQARYDAIQGQLAATNRQLVDLMDKERELDVLMRERELAVASYASLAKELDEAQLLDKLALQDNANVRILQTAQAPAEPNNLQLLVVAVGFVLAMLATLFTAFLCDLMRSGYLTPEQLERAVGLPVLATLPLRPSDRQALLRA